MRLRQGEDVVRCKGGAVCIVCKSPIPTGPAVRVSRWNGRLRHQACFPVEDTRQGKKRKARRS